MYEAIWKASTMGIEIKLFLDCCRRHIRFLITTTVIQHEVLGVCYRQFLRLRVLRMSERLSDYSVLFNINWTIYRSSAVDRILLTLLSCWLFHITSDFVSKEFIHHGSSSLMILLNCFTTDEKNLLISVEYANGTTQFKSFSICLLYPHWCGAYVRPITFQYWCSCCSLWWPYVFLPRIVFVISIIFLI